MPWPCKIEAYTHRPDGKRVTMARWFDGSGGLESAVLHEINKRKDKGYPFLGCEVFVTTPLHNLSYIFEWNGSAYYLQKWGCEKG